MLAYRPPLAELRFAFEHWLDLYREWSVLPELAALDRDTVEQVLAEAGRFAAEVLLPLNAAGDAEGCRYEGGSVATPTGYRAAYQAFVAAGWPALACDAEIGGQGLPLVVNAAVYEMFNATCHAWTMYPSLSHGAIECIRAHGSAILQREYLPKLVSGEWLSAMCLTEAGAGSDLGLLRTRAEPVAGAAAGLHEISGTKIFISGGEHDLSENVVHLVLARLPGAPLGTKGISLFLVPKKLAAPGGLRPNAIHCDGIERKMGLKGSATCVLTFERAHGWLVGEPNAGLAAMFVMMNAARVAVAFQGVGHAEITHQNAVRYAVDRRQSRAVPRAPGSAAGADPIIEQPAVQRLLLEQRATLQAERLLGLWLAHMLDVARHSPDAARRALCLRLASLLTPIAKALCTEDGFRLSSTALQVFGGYGYVYETGIEQSVRDSRVAMIYEGTNEVQAIDLLQRKVLADGGRTFGELMQLLGTEAAACRAVPDCEAFGMRLQSAADALSATTAALLAAAPADPGIGLRVADDYLHAAGVTVLAYIWSRAARVALAAGAAADGGEKVRLAGFFFDYLLPEAARRLGLVHTAAAAAAGFTAAVAGWQDTGR